MKLTQLFLGFSLILASPIRAQINEERALRFALIRIDQILIKAELQSINCDLGGFAERDRYLLLELKSTKLLTARSEAETARYIMQAAQIIARMEWTFKKASSGNSEVKALWDTEKAIEREILALPLSSTNVERATELRLLREERDRIESLIAMLLR